MFSSKSEILISLQSRGKKARPGFKSFLSTLIYPLKKASYIASDYSIYWIAVQVKLKWCYLLFLGVSGLQNGQEMLQLLIHDRFQVARALEDI